MALSPTMQAKVSNWQSYVSSNDSAFSQRFPRAATAGRALDVVNDAILDTVESGGGKLGRGAASLIMFGTQGVMAVEGAQRTAEAAEFAATAFQNELAESHVGRAIWNTVPDSLAVLGYGAGTGLLAASAVSALKQIRTGSADRAAKKAAEA